MKDFLLDFEHHANSVEEIRSMMVSLGVTEAVLKMLPKNANDKNQIYIASDFGLLYDLFSITLAERGASISETKNKSEPGRSILEGVFDSFFWVQPSGAMVEAKRVKVIVYPQYPEARLSGFQTVHNSMPQSLSIAFIKQNESRKRLLVLGRLPGGGCLGLVYLDISDQLEREISSLPSSAKSKVCKKLLLEHNASKSLQSKLSAVVGRPMLGCKLSTSGATVPFSGTQVCGYTLEHALGIIPNSAMNGDIDGIELKTHTQLKVTLFTPEPDFGLYAKDFKAFMHQYGYKDSSGDYRLTGIHRANERCAKSGLTLRVREYRVHEIADKTMDWIYSENGARKVFPYDAETSLTSKMDAVEVVLEDDAGVVAAGWSLERLLNCWGAKHNEVVYISANKEDNLNEAEKNNGFIYQVTFDPTVVWCRNTSAERMLKAIDTGVIFLDPAPKLHATDPSKSKRRAQWRVNDITKAVHSLYAHVDIKKLNN